ncbi:MAG TPA: superoxide dismutase family protein [Candidatus Omnitrophota bacterium]|nr:superoxide dismutase family protein [Candidatus Omnitrophota bacterium]
MKRCLTEIIILMVLALVTTWVVAQEDSAIKEAADEVAEAPAWAQIKATAEGSSVNGEVKFYPIENGLKAIVNVAGVTPGKHGFHVHENGSCDEAGNAAGSHYNPHGVQHGFLPKDGAEMAHMGDMGNLEVNEAGEGSLEVELAGVVLEGDHGILGKAVILHEKEDDFGQPTGNAGGRIGCGIIETAAAMEAGE